MPSHLRLVHDSDAPSDLAGPHSERPALSFDNAYWLARMRLEAAEKRLAANPTQENAEAALDRRLAFARASRALIRAVRG